MKITNRDSAVSPVVGVMLMLVVTIIIAAVVSAFSGGMFASEKKTPQATLGVEVNVGDGIRGEVPVSVSAGYSYPPGYTCENNYFLFEHKGGDSFDLNDIEIALEDRGSQMTFTQTDRPTTDVAFSCRNDPANAKYLNELGPNADGFISTGEKFTLNIDGNYFKDSIGKRLVMTKDGTEGRLTIAPNKRINYMIIDRLSGKTIQSGYAIVNI